MPPRALVWTLLALVPACSFPKDGVPLGDDIVDGGADACVATGEELCDGHDNDCDGMFDEDFNLGMCDGPDDDVCMDDPQVCSEDGTEMLCSTVVGDQDVELCNDADDDCDLLADETFPVEEACDGPDSDECPEGQNVCNQAGDGVDCDDDTGDTVEVCNNLDDDCDGPTDEDFDLQNDPDTCGGCLIQCTNPNGEVDCQGGDCAPTCNANTQDCDGNPINGCENLNTNPNCAADQDVLDPISGDTGGTVREVDGFGEAVFSIEINEDSGSPNQDPNALVRLVSAAGSNYDLTVICAACNGATSADSESTGVLDQLQVRKDDGAGDDDFTIIVLVRLASTSQSECSEWTLTITGNTDDTPNLTCP
jgi:hypothetical protein